MTQLIGLSKNQQIGPTYTEFMVRIFRPIPVERLKLLVFDLDGTLIDSAKDLCNSVNAMLLHCGLEPLPDKQIASFIGDGVLMLVRRALGVEVGAQIDEAFLNDAYEFFLNYYRDHKLDFTYAYAGVLDALSAVSTGPYGRRRAMTVLTNKPVRPARAICEALGLAPHFMSIYGGNSFASKKPDPEGMRALMAEAGAAPEETVLIGDSNVDVQTARNAGVWSIGCTFGLSPHSLEILQPDILVDSPSDWTEVLSPEKIDLRR
jgi:phosphoglycolate phosphatase